MLICVWNIQTWDFHDKNLSRIMQCIHFNVRNEKRGLGLAEILCGDLNSFSIENLSNVIFIMKLFFMKRSSDELLHLCI